ncbi:MAG: D-glycerate dehydrogenase [Planctomycetota bacterium]
MKPRVFVTRKVYPAAIAILQEDFVVDYRDTYEIADPDTLKRKLKLADGVVCQLTDAITKDILQDADKLKVVSQVAVGHDNIDVAAATARGIVVTNTPGVLTESTADLTFALILSVARRVPEAERYLRSGSWKRWDIDLLAGIDPHQKTLGIVGMGRIGQAVARRAAGFSMRILYSAPRRLDEALERELRAQHVPLRLLLQQSDFVTLHVPYRESTHHLIGIDELAVMKRGAFLINTSRGSIVHEAALVAALEEKMLSGAGLDVFEHEPKVDAGLLAMDNVVLLPHIASATIATRTRMCTLAAENCAAVLKGVLPKNPVNVVPAP